MSGSTVTRVMWRETLAAPRRGLLVTVLALLTVTGILVLAKPAGAATFTVSDGDVAALISAINTANQNAGSDTISLASVGTYTLTQVDNEFFGPNGLPAIGSQITIEGNGAKIVRSGAGWPTPEFRLFYVFPNGNLTLRDVELGGGLARGGNGGDSSYNYGAGGGAAGVGGAIFNAGTLSIQGSTLYGNTAYGGFGGDYNGSNDSLGILGGGGGIAGDAFVGGDGGPGSYDSDFGCSGLYPGGACYQSGIRGGDHGGNGGPGGGGGAGHNAGEGGFGGFGGGGGGGGHQGGRGGHGGGYMVGDGSIQSGASGFGGGGGGGGNMNPSYGGSSGGPGEGGYGGGDGLNGAGGGGGGFGGAIFNHAGTLIITNSTIASNDAVGGFGGTGAGGIPGEDGVGLGGGLFNRNGAVTIQSSTFVGNLASTLRPDRAPTMAGGTGGGIYNLGDYQTGVTVTMNDTIVADSRGIPPNGGSISDYGEHGRNGGTFGQGNSNIIESGGGWFTGTVTADPKFDPEQDNGGPAHPYTLGSGSPAIDNAGTDCPATDQRGVTRPQDGDANGSRLCDIGAVEVAPPLNDAFSNARTVSGTNATVRGSNLAATREPGEPQHDFLDPDSGSWTGDHSVWFRWTATYSGSATVDTCQTKVDSILAVYTGDQLGSLTRITDNNNHADCNGSWGSKLTFDATAGTTYRIAVGDAGGLRQNTFTLKLGLSDTTPPDTTIASGPSGPTNDNTPTFSFTGSDNASAPGDLLFSHKVDGNAWSAYSSATSVTLSALGDGPHTLYVKARDQAGNEDQGPAERGFTVDTISPETTLDPSGPAGTTSATSARFSFTSEVGTTFGCRLNRQGETAGTFTACAAPKDYPNLADGSYTFEVRATDRAGNVEDPAVSRSFRVDTTPPQTPTITGEPLEGSASNSRLVSFTFGSEEGATFLCSLDGESFSGCTSGVSFTDLSDGEHRFEVKARDQVGNESAPAVRLWSVDATGPTVKTWTPTGKKVSPTAKPTVVFSEAMDEAWVLPDTFFLKKGTSRVAATVSYVEAETVTGARVYKAVLVPNKRLRSGAKYTVTVTAAVADTAGNPLGVTKTWRFTVR